MEVKRRTGESRSSAGLKPGGIAKYEEGETERGERGSEGGGIDLNLGTLEPVLSAMRSERPPARPKVEVVGMASSSAVRRSEKVVVMNDAVEKEKDGGCEFAEVSKLPVEEAIKIKNEKEIKFERRGVGGSGYRNYNKCGCWRRAKKEEVAKTFT